MTPASSSRMAAASQADSDGSPNKGASDGGYSFPGPRATIRSMSSGNGRYSAFASDHGARIQTSRSSLVVRITGMVLGWIGATTP